ncbi:MAG: hypothetical protein U9R50_11395 [Campylobacterota bacterium]|nr:hypothetical protein [Campylobacterota bacterium]
MSIAALEKEPKILTSFSSLTTLPGFALSSEYFEPRNRFYADNHELLFVGMKPINTMDFIYAE